MFERQRPCVVLIVGLIIVSLSANSNLRIQPPRRSQDKMVPKRLHFLGLKDKHFQQYFADTLNSRLDYLPLDSDDLEENCIEFINTIYLSAHAVLGSTKCKHQDWFNENDMQIRKLLDKKHRLHKTNTLPIEV